MATKLSVGTPLPSFTLPDQDGSQQSLPDPAGPNLLIFYRGDW
ncbi:MAG TPA: hypothetical protein VHW91_09160 [Candidatus Dormibacteraeota bacterium]|jgi:peroxiredoxin|nr:hypothetical protein [Candidatus Dormibacteraeota bacterium]